MPDPSFYAKLGKLSSVMVILPGCMAGGWIIGYYLIDRYLKSFPWGTITLIMLGAGAGFYEIFQLLTRDDRDNGNQS
jgi:F0F1-type ATP synthase assembly protein I